MPLRPQFEGNVGQQTLHLGSLVVKLKPAVRAVRPLLGSPAGEALSALLFLGKQQVTPQTIARVKGQLSEEQFDSLRRHAVKPWLTRMLE